MPDRETVWPTAAVLALAFATVAGSLWLSLGMGLKACPLCFYQRTFAMSVAAVLAVGLLARMQPASSLSLLALPLAAGGLGVAVFHVRLELAGKLECPAGILGIGTAPQQALAALALLFAALLADAVRGRQLAAFRWSSLIGGVALGALLAFACIESAPPPPPPPTAPYAHPADICRPPHRVAEAARVRHDQPRRRMAFTPKALNNAAQGRSRSERTLGHATARASLP